VTCLLAIDHDEALFCGGGLMDAGWEDA